MNFDYKILEDAFSKLPEELQHVLTSPHIVETIKEIAEKNGLLIDQMSTLFDITSFTMLGLLPSSKFVETLSNEASIPTSQAQIIANEINSKVFSSIKSMMRKEENIENQLDEKLNQNNNVELNTFPPKPPHIADLEKAGGFTIEHDGINSLGRGIDDEEGIGSDNFRAIPARNKWSPLGQTVIPTRNLGSIPVAPSNPQNAVPNAVPTSVSAPIQNQNPTPFTAPISTPILPPTPTIPKKIETPTPITNQTPVVETKPEIKTNIQEEIEKEIASALKTEPASSSKPEIVTPVVPETITKKASNEPLANQLLSMLNKKPVEKEVAPTEKKESTEENVSTVPSNLPIEEKEAEIPQKNPEIKQPEFAPKIETTPAQIPVIPTPIKINIQQNITPPPSPVAANIPPPIKVPNPASPKPPPPQSKPRSFDPYREPVK